MQKYTYNVLAKPDGTFGVNITPSHATNPQPYVFYNFANGDDSKSIQFNWNTAKPNLKIRAKYKPKTSSNGGATLGFKNLGDNNDFRFFAYSPSFAYWDLGSGRITASGYGYNSGIKEVEIGNNYIKDLETGNVVVQGSRVTTDCITVTGGKAYLMFGYVYINYVQVLDEDDNLLLDLVEKQDASGHNCLYDRLTGTYYGADWGMTWSEEGFDTNGWYKAKSIDFGGGYLDFTTDARSPIMATQSSSLTSITNVNLSQITKYSGKGYVGYGVFQNYTNLEKVSIVALPIPKGMMYNGYMFKGDAKLKEVTLEHKNTYLNSQYDYEGVFDGCKNLKTIPDTFDFSRVTDFSTYTPFRNCGITSFTQHLSAMTNGQSLFTGCTDLVSVDLGNTTRLTGNANMFSGKTKLETVNMSVSGITAWNNMFAECPNIINFNLKNLGVETSLLKKTKVTSLDYLADNAKTVTNGEWFVMTTSQYNNYPHAVATLRDKGWTVYTENTYPKDEPVGSENYFLIGDCSFTFNSATFINQLEGIEKWMELPASASTAWTSLYRMFIGNRNLKEVKFTNLAKVTRFQEAFCGCTQLNKVIIDTRSGTDFGNMFNGCAIEEIELDLTNATNVGNMCIGCGNLKKATIKGGMSNITTAQAIFHNCRSLSGDFKFDMPKCTNASYLFSYAPVTSFEGYLPLVTDMHEAFYFAQKIEKIVLYIPKITNANSTFARNSSLKDLYITQLPKTTVTLNVSESPVNYDSFVYMATTNEVTNTGCTLSISNDSKNLSATTDVTMWWDTLIGKGYHINGYASQGNPYNTYKATADNAPTLSEDCGVYMSEEGAMITIDAPVTPIPSEGAINVYMVFHDKVVKWIPSCLSNGTYHWYTTEVEGGTEWNGLWFVKIN